MIEIKSILDTYGIKYIDKKLYWGAKLSDYKDELTFDGMIYGIELEVDITPPDNYIEIDHHGENDQKPSSLEQVAKILNISLTKKQKLISANDSRYISGMKSLGTTQKECDEIRKLDRLSQGIKQKDEILAKKSVKNSTTNKIYSTTPYFSAVSDIAYYQYNNYIIYNDTKINFYAYLQKLVLKFLAEQNIKDDDIYFGGGEFGFVGIKDKVLNNQEIQKLIKEFEKVEENKEKIYSYHTFMLPFTYGKDDKKDIIKDWAEDKYGMGYNEKAYFHDFFISSINNAEYYTRTFDNDEFIMCKSQEYKLALDSTNLKMFDNFNIGILTVNLKNINYKESKAILEINDFTRRLYPEYLSYKKKESGLVPNSVLFNGVKEEFEFEEYSKIDSEKIRISKIIDQFIPTSKIKKAVDDRMFTMSFYNNPVFANQLKNDHTSNNKWYEYIFIDGNGKNIQDNAMQKDLLEKATYSRWKDYGTMYGMSKYSFVCLANSDFPLVHMQTMYQSMFTILLMVRATLLKFSSEVSVIAEDIDKKNITKDVENIYKRYIQFVNGYYFREITAKDQGLELYEQAIETLKIERDIKDLDDEIEELHKFVELQRQKDAEKETEKTNKKLNNITIYGGLLLGVSALTGFFGMNVGGENDFSWWLVIPALVLSTWYGYNKFYKGES